MKTSTLISYSILAGSLFGGWVLFNNYHAIQDWWFLRSYAPSGEISTLATDSFMSNKGRDLFYVSDPAVNNASDFNANCPFRERSYVLGCFKDLKIFIFDVTDQRLDGIKEVTAAHEMLHVAYHRLDDGQKSDLNSILDRQYELIEDSSLLDLIDQYRNQDASSIHNEMHSLFGTEVATLLPELERHYSDFFSERSKLVTIAQDYANVFAELREEAEKLAGEIDQLKSKITSLESQITDQKAIIEQIQSDLLAFESEIEAARDQVDPVAESRAVDQYNALIPQLDTTVDDHNGLVDSYNNSIDLVNKKVETYNTLASEQGELIESIDSRVEAI